MKLATRLFKTPRPILVVFVLVRLTGATTAPLLLHVFLKCDLHKMQVSFRCCFLVRYVDFVCNLPYFCHMFRFVQGICVFLVSSRWSLCLGNISTGITVACCMLCSRGFSKRCFFCVCDSRLIDCKAKIERTCMCKLTRTSLPNPTPPRIS